MKRRTPARTARRRTRRQEEDDGDDKDADKKDEKPKEPVKIDVEGFERRAIQPGAARGFMGLQVAADGKLIYGRRIGVNDGGDGGGGMSIKLFDVNDEKHEEKTLAEKAGASVVRDGKKLLLNDGRPARRRAGRRGQAHPHRGQRQCTVEAARRVARDPGGMPGDASATSSTTPTCTA
jgi:hypothetical protein